MRAYFRRYRDALDLPVMLYQIPRRTTVAAFADTVQAMAEDGSIIGMKYSSYDMPDFIRTVKYAGDKIAILSGEEPLFATHVALGARGGVLASATIYPKIWIEIFGLARQGKLKEALKLQDKIDPVVDSIYVETNPGPLKEYMALAGMPVGGVRLPLMGPSEKTLAGLKAAAAQAKAVSLA
jgi:4-hydroxy-tetrahydrodipicolinate synthase